MLIEHLTPHFVGALYGLASEIHTPSFLYLLIDGAFISGAHRIFNEVEKEILFDSFPCTGNATRDVSPFLIAFDPHDRRQRNLLDQCSGWPMISVIETSESLVQLSNRLAAWCVVEVDRQRFNFRFPDTRRLPAVFKALTEEQRANFTGPMKRWVYAARNGQWEELPIICGGDGIALDPRLDERQFGSLIEDSRVDEILVMLNDRGHDVYRSPFRSYSHTIIALNAASIVNLNEDEVLQWCTWFWQQDKDFDNDVAVSVLQHWRKGHL